MLDGTQKLIESATRMNAQICDVLIPLSFIVAILSRDPSPRCSMIIAAARFDSYSFVKENTHYLH
jgi:hypothetical protein